MITKLHKNSIWKKYIIFKYKEVVDNAYPGFDVINVLDLSEDILSFDAQQWAVNIDWYKIFFDFSISYINV